MRKREIQIRELTNKGEYGAVVKPKAMDNRPANLAPAAEKAKADLKRAKAIKKLKF
jgi:hypothetical protein